MLVILAVLITLAAPSFARLVQTNSVSASANTFLADVRFARSEGIRRGGGVVMCRSDSPEDVEPACGLGSGVAERGWATGWLIFHDLDGDAERSPTEPILRTQACQHAHRIH